MQSQKHKLGQLLTNREDAALIYARARSMTSGLPGESFEAHLAHYALLVAGLPVTFSPDPACMVDRLRGLGWRLVPATDEPLPSDLFVTSDQGQTVGLGFVVGVAGWERGYFLAMDGSSEGVYRPYRRCITCSDRADVAYWLRIGGG